MGEEFVAIEEGKLPSKRSAQACELYDLKQALEILSQKRGTIYTCSKNAFGIVHTSGKIWEERGLLNSKGKGLIYKNLIPEEVAVVYIKGHQKGMTQEV